MIEAALLGFAVFAGTATDALGDRLGGISSLRWEDTTGRLYALSDRGPGDGTVAYAPRFHVFTATISAAGIHLELERTVLFKDKSGRPFTGLIESTMTRIDPEGLALAADGTLWVSEEYEPAIYRFRADGSFVSKISAPEAYRPRKGHGREDNRGFEGLCLTPDGRSLAALLQSPLAQDGGRMSRKSRMLIYDLGRPRARPKDLVVEMADAASFPPAWGLSQGDLSFNECEAVSTTTFILLERDNRGLGAKDGRDSVPRFKRAARVDLHADGTTTRNDWLDLLSLTTKAGIPPPSLPPKHESLAWGPVVAGQPTMWLAIDNDFKPGSPTFVFLLAVPGK